MILRFGSVFLFLLTTTVWGQQPEPPKPEPPKAEAAGHTAEEHHRHHISGFLGASHHASENGATFGGEYAFRFNKRLSIGAEIEHAGGAFRDEIFTFPFIVDIYKRIKFATGPGWEAETKEVVGHNGETEKERERKFVYRFGLHYEIPVKKRFSVTPNVAWDISSTRTVFVYGVSFGFGF